MLRSNERLVSINETDIPSSQADGPIRFLSTSDTSDMLKDLSDKLLKDLSMTSIGSLQSPSQDRFSRESYQSMNSGSLQNQDRFSRESYHSMNSGSLQNQDRFPRESYHSMNASGLSPQDPTQERFSYESYHSMNSSGLPVTGNLQNPSQERFSRNSYHSMNSSGLPTGSLQNPPQDQAYIDSYSYNSSELQLPLNDSEAQSPNKSSRFSFKLYQETNAELRIDENNMPPEHAQMLLMKTPSSQSTKSQSMKSITSRQSSSNTQFLADISMATIGLNDDELNEIIEENYYEDLSRSFGPIN